ncbi:MAG TPA: TolC family protein [Phycisphaerales bacterium]|nr:TolC family protein [Phycisphaerales bacterium]
MAFLSHSLFPVFRFSLFALSFLALPACESLDHRPDIDRAASLVHDRSGLSPDWSASWEESLLTPWDGLTPLSADHAVAIALRNNRALRAKLETIAAARADLVQSGLLPNPVVAVSLGFPINHAEGVKIGVSVVEQFAQIWLIPAKRAAASADLDQRILESSSDALALVAETRSLHARLLFAQRGLSLRREHLSLLERSSSAIESRVRAGEASRLDLSRQRLEHLKLRAEIIELDSETDRLRRRLLELLGVADRPSNFELTDAIPMEPSAPAEGQLPTEPEIIELARVQRLDVAASRAEYSAALARVDQAGRSRLEHLDAGLGYERDDDAAQTLGPTIELSIPIFDTGAARESKAEAEARRALLLADATTQRAVREAREAWVHAASTAAALDIQQRELLPEAERAMTLSEQTFAAGRTDLFTQLVAQRDLLEARTHLADLELAHHLALIELERAVGGMLPP